MASLTEGTPTRPQRAGLYNQEYCGHVYVCTHPREPWGRLWPALRHYD